LNLLSNLNERNVLGYTWCIFGLGYSFDMLTTAIGISLGYREGNQNSMAMMEQVNREIKLFEDDSDDE
jgi:hypothetical protein